MLNYFNSYKNFLNKKKITDCSFRKARKRGYEIHHIYPKSLGGKKKVILTEYDHCIAHILYAAASIQRGKGNISYVLRDCFSENFLNPVLYWNPISKLKVQMIDSQKNTDEVMTVLDAAKKISALDPNDLTKNHEVNWILRKILDKIIGGDGEFVRYYGFKMKFVF